MLGMYYIREETMHTLFLARGNMRMPDRINFLCRARVSVSKKQKRSHCTRDSGTHNSDRALSRHCTRTVPQTHGRVLHTRVWLSECVAGQVADGSQGGVLTFHSVRGARTMCSGLIEPFRFWMVNAEPFGCGPCGVGSSLTTLEICSEVPTRLHRTARCLLRRYRPTRSVAHHAVLASQSNQLSCTRRSWWWDQSGCPGEFMDIRRPTTSPWASRCRARLHARRLTSL